jgi:hypothetical protein
VASLAREAEGIQRGDVGGGVGHRRGVIGALEWEREKWGDGRGSVPGEKKKEGRLEVGGGTDKGSPPVRKKKRGRLPFRDGIRWAAPGGPDWAAPVQILFSLFFFFFLLFFSVFIFLLYLLNRSFKFSQTNF